MPITRPCWKHHLRPPSAKTSFETVTLKPSFSSILVDAKQPHPMERGQLGQQHEQQADEVEAEVDLVVLGVPAGQDEQADGDDGEELARGRALETSP